MGEDNGNGTTKVVRDATDSEATANGNCQEQLRTFEVVDYECPWCWPIMETLEAGAYVNRNNTVGSHWDNFKASNGVPTNPHYGKIFKTDGWQVWMEASCTGAYTDPGARCYDHTDGIMEGLEISEQSDVVNVQRPALCVDPDEDDDSIEDFDPLTREQYCNDETTTGNYVISYKSAEDSAHALDTTHSQYDNFTDIAVDNHITTEDKRCYSHSRVKSYLKLDSAEEYTSTDNFAEGEKSYLDAQRLVSIRDYTRPEIDMDVILTANSAQCDSATTCTVEAGYAFSDTPPTAYDDLCWANDDETTCCCQMDGTGTNGRTVIATGDAQVMMAAQYQSFHTCQDIFLATNKLNTDKELVASFNIGEHDITLAGGNTDGTSGTETIRKAWCDNTTENGNFATWIIPHAEEDCPGNSVSTTGADGDVYKTQYEQLSNSKLHRLKDAQAAGKELCCVEEEHTDDDREEKLHPVDVSHSFAGKYVFKYNIHDCAGNPAETTYRTITVQDTLPPVIQLKLFNELIQQGSYNSYTNTSNDPATDIGHDSTPGHDFDLQGLGEGANWMEESPVSSTNGWIVGAIAAAVTGIALVAYSRFTSAQTIEV